MAYWLMKSNPTFFGIDDLQRLGTEHWDGVRNYRARNFMRDDMQVGDKVFFYHSSAKPSGVAGIMRVFMWFGIWSEYTLTKESSFMDLCEVEENYYKAQRAVSV